MQSPGVPIATAKSKSIHDHSQCRCRVGVVEGVYSFSEVHLGCIYQGVSILFNGGEVKTVAVQWLVVEEDKVLLVELYWNENVQVMQKVDTSINGLDGR